MGLSKEELIRRREDKNVNYIVDHICNKDSGKSYVFISYKSDDWEQVLQDIVYKLVKDYGLNVYFDGDFNGHNPLWTEQFPENMNSENCKGVLAFVDDKYACSYATLMELLYSQVGCQETEPPYNLIKKEVVPVFLSKLTLIKDKGNTGLGVNTFDNKEVNLHAKAEKELFDRLFKKAEKLEVLDNTINPYKNAKVLSKELCAAMVREVLASIGANDNYYQEGIDLEDIVKSIKSACGEEVFSDISEPESGPKPEPEPKPESGPKPGSNKNPLRKNTTLKEFSELCEHPDVCLELRKIRETGKKQYFDYLMAALLRGCDEAAFKKSKGVEQVSNRARWNYCTYAVSRTLNLDNPECGASQFTWTSNARKAVGIEGAGKLGASSEAFEKIGEDVTLGQIEQYFTDATEAAFSTRDNALVLQSLNAILQMDVLKILEGIGV